MKNVFEVGDKVVALPTTNGVYTRTREDVKWKGVVISVHPSSETMYVDTISSRRQLTNDLKADNDDYFFKLVTPPTPEEAFWKTVSKS